MVPQEWGAARPPHVVEAAEGRLHYGGWGGGEHPQTICTFILEMCFFAYLTYVLLFGIFVQVVKRS